MVSAKILGDFGEFLVGQRLKAKGHELVRTKYRKWGGEIDIISTKGKYIYFSEVKTRICKRLMETFDLEKIGLTQHKLAKIIKCAKYFDSYRESKFDAYFLQVFINKIPKDDSESLKAAFSKGNIRVVQTYIKNLDMEILGPYNGNLIEI